MSRFCRFISSDGALIALVGIAISLLQPVDIWIRVFGAAVLTPLVVIATGRFSDVISSLSWTVILDAHGEIANSNRLHEIP